MNFVWKKVSSITLALAIAGTSVGCSTNTSQNTKYTNNKTNTDITNTSNNNNNNNSSDSNNNDLTNKSNSNENTSNDNTKSIYSKNLAKYFPIVEGTVLNYTGSVEYAHTWTLNKVTKEDSKLKLNFKGEIIDMSGGEGPSKEERILETQYVINEDSVIEIQKNKDRRYSQSIIREETLLKEPIKTGNNWVDTVNIDGKDYEVKTNIIEVTTNENGKSIVKTETTIEGIEYYPNNTYKETRTFEEGKGIINYTNIILFPKAYEGDKDAHMEFMYHLNE